MIGSGAGYNSATGAQNVFVGNRAGYNNSGEYNVFIGAFAGYDETGSNKLYISNSSTTTPLIWGDFNNKRLVFNANTGINSSTYSDVGLITCITSSSSYSYGVIGDATGGTYNRGLYGYGHGGTYAYGVYGYATGGSTNYAGYFSGNIYVSGSVLKSSDKRLKDNILPLKGSLKKVLNLQGVTYTWKSNDEIQSLMKSSTNSSQGNSYTSPECRFNFSSGTEIGVVAQDVEQILPEIVGTDADGLKSVDYTKIIPLLIEAIKEQQEQIEALTKEVELLKTKK